MLKKEELLIVEGGASGITASLLSSLNRIATTIMEAGRAIGSALRRIKTKNLCVCK